MLRTNQHVDESRFTLVLIEHLGRTDHVGDIPSLQTCSGIDAAARAGSSSKWWQRVEVVRKQSYPETGKLEM